jgi:peptide-methionine (S)-S-oxide reductase
VLFSRPPVEMIAPEDALPGRDVALEVPAAHHVHGRSLTPPWPEGHETLVVGMGCFWGAERIYWELDGVWTTAVGYAAGFTPHPTYEETCTGRTGHTEAVLVVFDPQQIDHSRLLQAFWENHDPTQVMGQGNDIGTQYRSVILPTSDEQHAAAVTSRERYQRKLHDAGFGDIATQILTPAKLVDGLPETWYYAEGYHQQYLSKNPRGYCNHGFCQVAY